MTNINIPPGLFDENVELFSYEGTAMALHNGQAVKLFDLPAKFLKKIEKHLNQNEPAERALELAGYSSPEAKLNKYVVCRFGHFDSSPDFKNGELVDSEFVDCGYRGKCPMEGVVCGSVWINKRIVSTFEIQLIKLLAKEDTIPVIAEKLGISINTLETRKKILFEKLGVLSRPRMVSKCYDIGILKPVGCLN
ncbi:MAG: hypothetical protein KAF41_03915 [Flavobacterium sp.]|nr:hypothetical protein [Flavobacterium sp.]PZO26175.1 MAG: hypothetical protein DCE86_14855 [Flavobacteriaceae bacterium]